MELSNVAKSKIDPETYKQLKAAAPSQHFTKIMINFQIPELQQPRDGEAKLANITKIREAFANGIKALETVEGLSIDNNFDLLASAMVSGSAEKIVAMLELPEVKLANATEGIVIRPAAGQGR